MESNRSRLQRMTGEPASVRRIAQRFGDLAAVWESDDRAQIVRCLADLSTEADRLRQRVARAGTVELVTRDEVAPEDILNNCRDYIQACCDGDARFVLAELIELHRKAGMLIASGDLSREGARLRSEEDERDQRQDNRMLIAIERDRAKGG